MTPYRIVLADDHAMVRQLVRGIIHERGDLRVIGEAQDGIELLELLQEIIPDLIIVDISMPRLRGLEATKEIKKAHPEVKVLILTMHKSEEYLAMAMSYGADGYMLKEEIDFGLHSAIQTIQRGNVFISPPLNHCSLASS
jgi:DNA-binding NarL/FixJ family response regulator